jgi:hypothetical protein
MAAMLAIGAAVGILNSMDPSNAVVHTVYREHPKNYSAMTNTNTGDEVGDTLFILVDIDGAKTWTPSTAVFSKAAIRSPDIQ